MIKPEKQSRGADYPWQVWARHYQSHHSNFGQFASESFARSYIKTNPELHTPVIVYIDIPPMEY